MSGMLTLLVAALSAAPAHVTPAATPIVEGERVRVELNDGHAIEGRLVEVRPDVMRFVDDGDVRRARLREALEEERRHHAPPRPVGFSLTASF